MEQTFGEWLKKRRKAIGLTGAEVARRSGVTRAFISSLEKNRTSPNGALIKPSVETVDAVAISVGVPISEARLIAGYAPSNIGEVSNEEKLLFCYRELPQEIRENVLLIVETLWRKYVRQKKK